MLGGTAVALDGVDARPASVGLNRCGGACMSFTRLASPPERLVDGPPAGSRMSGVSAGPWPGHEASTDDTPIARGAPIIALSSGTVPMRSTASAS